MRSVIASRILSEAIPGPVKEAFFAGMKGMKGMEKPRFPILSCCPELLILFYPLYPFYPC
jgi:hypothetical protein